MPAEKGDVRNLTASPGAHERSPEWSPDGSRVAYFSDASGEYELHVAPHDGKGDVKRYKLAGAGFYSDLRWSPDSLKVAFVDNSQSAFWLDLATGAMKRVGGNRVYTPINPLSVDWSPDSKWLAYVVSTQPLVNTVFAYSLDQDKSFPITDGLSEVTEPTFDKGGKYLYLFGSTDAGPGAGLVRAVERGHAARAQRVPGRASQGRRVAAREGERRGEAEEGRRARGEGRRQARRGRREARRRGQEARDREEGAVLDRLRRHREPHPRAAHPRRRSLRLQAGDAGHFYYQRREGRDASLNHYDLTKRKDETPLASADAYTLSADAKKVLYAKDRAFFITAMGPKIAPGEGRIAAADIEVRIDPRAEWAQIFNEAWRINRDYFYAPNMHGVDWPAMKAKYAAFLPDLATRGDLNRVIMWMCSELAVGHHRTGGGDRLEQPRTVPGGLLGADYEVANGRYRFKRVLGGLNWTPELRAPLTEPGVDVKAGEYLIAVNGRDVRPPANLYSFFENTSGKIVELTVGPNADGTGSRTVQAVPIASESALRNRDWVEGNLKKVDKATGGRVAYVYVPNTAAAGHTYFKRYFFPQAHKDAVIVDERFNGGGSVADYYIDILRRPFISNWAMRYGDDLKTPTASIQGPKVMIIDEMAGSGGDLLPWMFRKFKLGPLVGQRTWGGLVGILGFPVLMDGGVITAPNLAIWVPEEGWVVENEGVPPDIEVEQTPADVIAGRDPQLEKAIEVAMAELKKAPPSSDKRPAYPVRGKTLRGTVKK